MINFRDKYSQPVTYSAVGQMARISELSKSLLANDPTQLQRVLTAEQMVEIYCRNNPNDIDDNNHLNYPVLRKPGVTAINNLICDKNITIKKRYYT